MHEVLGQLQPILVAFEERQAAIKNKATPLMQQIQAAQAEKREIDAETKAQLDTLGDQNQALELEVQPFTWNADQLDTISQAMKAVIEWKGTLDPQLQGWSNLEALAAIVQEYKIKGL